MKTNTERRFLLGIIMFFNATSVLLAGGNQSYVVEQKFVFHQMEVIDAKSNELVESLPITGVIINIKIKQTEYLTISFGDWSYNMQIVNKIDEMGEYNIRVITYQGGEQLPNGSTYVANTYFFYDNDKNKNTPEAVRLDIVDSTFKMKFTGILKLKD